MIDREIHFLLARFTEILEQARETNADLDHLSREMKEIRDALVAIVDTGNSLDAETLTKIQDVIILMKAEIRRRVH